MGDDSENTGVGTIERPWDGNNLPEMNKQKPVVLDGKQVEDDDIRWQAAIFYAVSSPSFMLKVKMEVWAQKFNDKIFVSFSTSSKFSVNKIN